MRLRPVRGLILTSIAAALALAGCDDGSDFYADGQQACVRHVSKYVLEKNQRRIPESLREDFAEMNERMAENACDVIRSECAENPDGESCRKLVSDYL